MSRAAVVAAFLVSVGFVAPPMGAPAVAALPSSDTTTILSLPTDDNGVGVTAGGEEQLPGGPGAMAVEPDGTIWIADAVHDRILAYAPSGAQVARIDVTGIVVGMADLEIRNKEIAILDASSEIVVRLDPQTGGLIESIRLPSTLGLEAGLSGIAYTPTGDLLIELHGGGETASLAERDRGLSAIHRGRPVANGRFDVSDRLDPSRVRSEATVTYGAASIRVKVPHVLGGVYFLGERAGSVDVLVDETSQEADGTVRVDRTVRRFDPAGREVAVGRYPLRERLTYIPNGIVATPSGSVLALVTRLDRVDVVQITMKKTIASILPAGMAAAAADDATGADSVLACVDRRTMDNTRYLYTSNSRNLSAANKDAGNTVCPGRMLPHFMANPYKGITYRWGDWDTITRWNTSMAANKVAGDIGTTFEACSQGIDCSGFVQRIWGINDSKISTWDLAGNALTHSIPESSLIAYDIYVRAGHHVYIWHRWWNGGMDISESVAGAPLNLDRTVQHWVDSTPGAGYVPRRYDNVCA